MDVYYVLYRGRTGGVSGQGGVAEDEWEEQIVETVNNTINHMVSSSNTSIIDFVGWGKRQRKYFLAA